jgi:hypothetical protein
MKKIKICLLVFAALAVFQPASAQDITIDMTTLPPATVSLGDTTYVKMVFCNTDSLTATPANKVRTLISTARSNIVRATIDTLGTPMPASLWQQLSLTNGLTSSIRLAYLPSLAAGECTTFYVQIVPDSLGSDYFSSTIQWNGPQTQNPPNNTSNDNDTTSIFVSATPLPVTLTAFTAVKQGSTSMLNWNTASEMNNAGFEIERSANGSSFSKIGMVNSKAVNGNSHENLAYSYIDAKPMQGANFYRLRQVDHDGKSAYSKIELVTFGAAAIETVEAAPAIKVYPNPATNTVNIEAPEGSKVSVYNMAGRMEVRATGSGHLTTLDVSVLRAGNYTIHIIDNASGMSSHKLTIVR